MNNSFQKFLKPVNVISLLLELLAFGISLINNYIRPHNHVLNICNHHVELFFLSQLILGLFFVLFGIKIIASSKNETGWYVSLVNKVAGYFILIIVFLAH